MNRRNFFSRLLGLAAAVVMPWKVKAAPPVISVHGQPVPMWINHTFTYGDEARRDFQLHWDAIKAKRAVQRALLERELQAWDLP